MRYVRLKKVIATMLVVVLMFPNIPTTSLFATGEESTNNTISIDVTVNGNNGTEILDAKFEIDGEELGDEFVIQGTEEIEETSEEETSEEETSEEETSEEETSEEETSEEETSEEETSEEETSEEETSEEETSEEETSEEETSEEETSEEESSEEESSEVETEIIIEKTNVYTLIIDKPEDGAIINVYQDGFKNYRATITYQEGVTDYEVELVRYADITTECINQNGINVDGDEYSKNIKYGEYEEFILEFGDIVECTMDDMDEGNTVTKSDADGKKWKINISEPGEVNVIINSTDASEYEIVETYFRLTIDNEIYFSYQTNIDNYSNDSSVEIIEDENGNVEKVTKIISNEADTFVLELEGLYLGDIKYSISCDDLDGTTSEINEETGCITINDNKTLTVTAECGITGVSTSYIFEVKKSTSTLNVTLGGNLVSEGSSINVEYNQEFVLFAQIADDEFRDKYDITYTSNNDCVVIETKREQKYIVIKDVIDNEVTITIVAEPKDGAYYLEKAEFEFSIITNKSSSAIDVTLDGNSVNQNDIIDVVYGESYELSAIIDKYDDKYDISYSSSSSGVAIQDRDSKLFIDINDYVEEDVTITINATPKAGVNYLNEIVFEFKLNTIKRTNELNVTFNDVLIDDEDNETIDVNFANRYEIYSIIVDENYRDLYNIVYSSSDNSVAIEVDDNDLKTYLFVNNVVENDITITVTAVPKTEAYYLEEVVFTFKVKTNMATDIDTGLYYDGVLIQDKENIVLDDEMDISVVDNKEIIIFPLTAIVRGGWNNRLITDYKITFYSDDIDFVVDTDKIYIDNVDEIERNVIYEVGIKVSDNNDWINYFQDKYYTVYIMLCGENEVDILDNEYYTLAGLHVGFDGNYWKDYDASSVVATAKDLYSVGGTDAEYGMAESYEVPFDSNGELPLKEHKIYVSLENTIKPTRVYFGVDPNKPEISLNEEFKDFCSEFKNINDVICTNDSIIIKGNAKDEDGYLYMVELYIGDTKVSEYIFENDENEMLESGEFEFTLDASIYNGRLLENVKVVAYDVSKNTEELVIGNILFDKSVPSASISLSENNEATMYENGGKLFVSDDVVFDLIITDILSNEIPYSGLQGYVVEVNGNKLNIDIVEAGYIFSIDTSDYTPKSDGTITIKVSEIYDIAGNKGENVEYKIYIDKNAPTASFNQLTTEGYVKTDANGNFFNKDVTFTFNVSDNLTNVKTAKLKVGTKSFEGIVDNGKVSFKIPLTSFGNAELTLVDNVGHTAVISIKNIKNVNGTTAFYSNYILVENNKAVVEYKASRVPDKGNWYKSGLTYTITLTDKSSTDIAGLSQVNVYINDVEYSTKSYNKSGTVSDTLKVNIDSQWIDKVINSAGSYTVKVVVIDYAGNESTYNEKVYIDTIAPVISELTGVVDGSVNTGTVTVNVEITEKHFAESGNSTIVQVTKVLDGNTKTYEAEKFTYSSAKTLKAYTFTEDGTYEVVVMTEDAAGNVAENKTITFIIDNTAPIAQIIGVNNNKYYVEDTDVTVKVIESNYADSNIVISIEKELNDVVTVVNSQTFNKTQKESSLTQTFVDEGTYTIKVDAVDAAGNIAITQTVIFTIDKVDPMVEITGVEEGVAYRDSLIPSIVVKDNYYDKYSITLTKTGVYFNEDKTDVNNVKEIDVTDLFIDGLDSIENGAQGTFDTFSSVQENDGIYVLTVSATDLAGRNTTKNVKFSVNRHGSVYTFDDNLLSVMNTFTENIDEDFIITEYNADRLVEDSIKIGISRDGSPVSEVMVDTNEVDSNSGWYQYKYVIDKDNFKLDGVYTITVTSKDAAGNNSQNITYDELNVRFSVDTTKPEIIAVTNLSENYYRGESLLVNYEVFDAIGIKEIRVYLNDDVIQTVNKFDDMTSYAGSFTINESSDMQHVRFEIVDIAGNITDSDNEDDINSGKIPSFSSDITVSTDTFVIWYANKPLFYGTIAGAVAIVAALIGLIIFLSKKKKRKE